MNPRVRASLRDNQGALRARKTKIYLALLARLLKDHSAYEFLKPLSDALRRRDFLSLYAESDSLSAQKYAGATEHFVANQFALLIKKYPWPKDLLDLKPEENAVKSFLSAEKRCGLINRKFRFLALDRSRDSFKREASVARRAIRHIIGSTPNYQEWASRCDFGPGASIGVHGNATNYLAKLNAKRWSVSPGAINHAFLGISQNVHLLEFLYERGPSGLYSYDPQGAFASYIGRIDVVDYNKISFVPKTAKTMRSIAIEPLLTGYVQKGIDQSLRTRLGRDGTDLSDQSRNQRMALSGSLDDSDNGFVTIDLKSASDSISIELIRYLLPDDWFRLLWRTRSHAYELDDKFHTYEKFCSMGNGFCFPLETLVFVAACYACDCGTNGVDFSVYGDDIIVRKRYALPVLNLLKHWGFKANSEKTFLEGPFRESCGSDWFGGEDVRPFTLDYELDSVESVFKFLNLSRRSQRTSLFFECVRPLLIGELHPDCRWFRPFKGSDEAAIDSTGDEHMSAVNCSFNGSKWQWYELAVSPVRDFANLERCKDQPWLIGVALRGASSVRSKSVLDFLPEVTLRRETKTKIVRKGYVSTSNWLPPVKT